ncbi:merozoite surface protein MSA180, putative [Plasmodium yoelii]|uniref:Merozoite surface protein MSA180 n=3 Tax=Plasmodium yoelii TaxID=5861 RepID=A0AAE9WSF3_PLAYO|nr:merozoite surface protein MSA180, putative [Plasmodium yoelii]WBY59155.1 merozoite surface protein MSA180 [Plasmodium yoelii yoelii]CDU19323.1 conserved Plasmodium protein, unknown function [Plasmodium yoelii]VTZ79958.1 merozoite surface protein MSA180, putative [Plasmodium yoelii]|eukprot:XP_725085.2 merozoite surface protein MSA180, putative [Plasmodium yoelii]
MLKIFYFFSVIFYFLLISRYNADHNDQNYTKKAILLALLKNKFIDKKEYTKYDDINNALQYVKNSKLNINNINKFENFLSYLLKYHNINIAFNDIDTKILYMSGIFEGIYVDLDILDKDYVDTYFNNIHEQSSNIIKLILRSKVVTPEYINIPSEEENFEKFNNNSFYEKYEEAHESLEENNNDEHETNENNIENEIFNNNEEYKIHNLSEEINKMNDNIYNFIENINDENKMTNMENYIKDYPMLDDVKTKYTNDNIIINIYNTYFGYFDPNAMENPRKLPNEHPYISNLNLQIGNNILKDTNGVNSKFDEKNKYIAYSENKEEIQSIDNENSKDYSDDNVENEVLNNENDYEKNINNNIEDYNNDLYVKGEDDYLTFQYTYENPYYTFGLRNSLPNKNKENDSNHDINITNNNENMNEQNNKIDTNDSKHDSNDLSNNLTSKNKEKMELLGDSENKSSIIPHVFPDPNNNRPVYKRKELKSDKMKTKADFIDNEISKKIKNSMYVKIGQNGTNNFLSFFEFRDLSSKTNFNNLLLFIEYLKIFNITEAIIFIEKLNQLICISYCMEITDTLELSNNDMILYDGMSILFTKKNVDVKINNKTYHINLPTFKTILNLLNINKKTIPLVCPCKSYTNLILSYFKKYGPNAKCSFYHYNKPSYLEEYSTSRVLGQLASMQEKLPFIKRNGRTESKLKVDINEEPDIYSNIFYHNFRHSISTRKKKLDISNKIDHSDNDITYTDDNYVNIYYNSSLININDRTNISDIFIDEIKSKVSRINSYKIGKQIFTTYGNFGKDDHDLELKDTVYDPNHSRSKKLNNYVNNKNEKTKNDPNQNKKEEFQLKTNNGDKNKDDNVSNIEFSSIKDNINKTELKNSIKNKKNVSNKKENYNNLIKSNIYDNDNVSPNGDLNNKSSYLTNGDGGDDEDDDDDDKNNAMKELLKLKNSTKVKNNVKNIHGEKITETNVNKIINAKHLIQFFKGTEIWKPIAYCQHIAYINKSLDDIRYNENIMFTEIFEQNQVILYFSNNVQNKIKISIDYFLFLLEKVSLVNYVENLCNNFDLGVISKRKMNSSNINNISSIHLFLEKNIINFSEQFAKKNKYANELYSLSTSNLFSSKRDIVLMKKSYNNIIFDEKDIFDIFSLYLDEFITEKMIEETFLIPFAFIFHKENISTHGKPTLNVYSNEHIRRDNRGAINKFMFYGYKYIINNIPNFYADIIPNVPIKKNKLKEYTLVIYSDNPSMTNIIIKTTINVINIAFLLSILEVVLDTRAEQQFFSHENKFFPLNSFIILNEGINHLFFNYMPNENGSEYQL